MKKKKTDLKSEPHELDDCFGVWYGRVVNFGDRATWAAVEYICEQGYADYYYDGINKAVAKKVRR